MATEANSEKRDSDAELRGEVWPIKATVQVREQEIDWSLSQTSEWLTDHPSGDVTSEVEDYIIDTFGRMTEAHVLVYESGEFDISSEDSLTECARCGDVSADTPGIDFYEGYGSDGGELCEDCREAFEGWMERDSVVVAHVLDNAGNQIGVEVCEDEDAFFEKMPEIEERDHVGEVQFVGHREVLTTDE